MSNRTKNSTRNMLFGGINRFVSIFFPFIVRTVIIKVLGEEYLGLNSLFSSILQVLNVTELGFSSAISASMYKPIAEKDTYMISALLRLYKNIYKLLGYGLLIIGFGLLPFLKYFINGEPPTGVNIYLLFILYLLQTVCSYLFFAYKVTLINAHQRSDLTEKVGAISRIITSILQIFVIVVLKNIILYVFLNLICTLVYNLGCSYIADKRYPEYKCSGDLSNEIKSNITKNIGALAIQKIGNTVSTTLDTIIISAFLNLSTVAIFGNYNYIITAIITFISLIYGSITASIGNSIAIESIEKNYNDFKKFSFMNTWLVGWCAICLICIFQAFMKVWMGKKLLFSISVVIIMVIYFYISQIRRVVLTYKDAAGMWYADKYKPLVGCLVNLFFNIILVKIIGVSGVVISTIISYLFIELPWETHVLFKLFFKRSEMDYYKKVLLNTIKIVISGVITYWICTFVPDGIIGIIIRLVICISIPNTLLFIMFNKNEEFMEAKKIIKVVISNILPNKVLIKR